MPEQSVKTRHVTVVIVDDDESVIGALPEVEADEPWLQLTANVVRAVKAQFDLDITILRLHSAQRVPGAIHATYVAEMNPGNAARDLLQSWHGKLEADPLRLPYARPGGPAADVAWAMTVLADRKISLNDGPEQIRTWNLSSIWRLPTAAGDFWLKAVPPFFDHEGAVIERLTREPGNETLPPLVARSRNRILMEDIPGEDCYGASLAQILAMVEHLVTLQARWLGRIESLMAIGVPDRRDDQALPLLIDVIDRNLGQLNAKQRAILETFRNDLPDRLRRLRECEVPDTIVHGDYHPGNWRGDGKNLAILDWGDCYIGNPLLDRPALLERVPADDVAQVDRHWRRVWQEHLPGADIERACALIEPIAAVKLAAVYQMFLDNIEVSERVYHADDPRRMLAEAATRLASE